MVAIILPLLQESGNRYSLSNNFQPEFMACDAHHL